MSIKHYAYNNPFLVTASGEAVRVTSRQGAARLVKAEYIENKPITPVPVKSILVTATTPVEAQGVWIEIKNDPYRYFCLANSEDGVFRTKDVEVAFVVDRNGEVHYKDSESRVPYIVSLNQLNAYARENISAFKVHPAAFRSFQAAQIGVFLVRERCDELFENDEGNHPPAKLPFIVKDASEPDTLTALRKMVSETIKKQAPFRPNTVSQQSEFEARWLGETIPVPALHR